MSLKIHVPVKMNSVIVRNFCNTNFLCLCIIILAMGLQSCSKDHIDPSLTSISEDSLRKLLSYKGGKWVKVTEDGYEEIIFSKRTVSYVTDKKLGKLGNLPYSRDGYDFVKEKNYMTIRFMKYGMVMQQENITSLSKTKFINAIDGHTYHRTP